MKKFVNALLAIAIFASCQPSVEQDLSFEELDAIVSDGTATASQIEKFAVMVVNRIEDIIPDPSSVLLERLYSDGTYSIKEDPVLTFKVNPASMAERLVSIQQYVKLEILSETGCVADLCNPAFNSETFTCSISKSNFEQSYIDNGGEVEFMLYIKTKDVEYESASGFFKASDIDVIDGVLIEPEITLFGQITDASTGKGIEGVPVSDGYSFTVTDSHGVYQMVANELCRKVFYTTPSEYKVAQESNRHFPAFYNSGTVNPKIRSRYDFQLEKLSAPEENFTLVMMGDPQCKNTTHSGRYKNETIASLKNALAEKQKEGKYLHPYAFTLGDITHDANSMWLDMRATMANIPLEEGGFLPFFQCIGNHDHNSLAPSGDYEATQKFTDTFGPTDYSLNRGNVHIIVMDDIIVYSLKDSSTPNGKTWKYNGGFTAKQIEWLKQDLALVGDKENKMVVLCLHIPFRNGQSSGDSDINHDKYYDTVLKMLTDFYEAHIMIGHTHYPDCFVHKSYVTQSGHPIYEHVHGAACGAWWNCNSNTDGAPNGYSFYEVEGNHMKNWIAKSTKDDWSLQLRVFDGDQIYTGSKGYTFCWSSPSNYAGSITAKGNSNLVNCLVADVWNDDDTYWKVEVFQNGIKKGDMTRLPAGSCCNVAIASFFFNEKGRTTSSYCGSKASHYWYFKTDTAPSEYKNWEIVATQTIPDTGDKNVYRSSRLTTDYSEF